MCFRGICPALIHLKEEYVAAWSWLMFIITEDHVLWTFWVFLRRAVSEQAAAEASPDEPTLCQPPAQLQHRALAALSAADMSGGGFPLWEALKSVKPWSVGKLLWKSFSHFRKKLPLISIKGLVQRKKLVDPIWTSVILAKSWNRDHVLDHEVVVTQMNAVWWQFRAP